MRFSCNRSEWSERYCIKKSPSKVHQPYCIGIPIFSFSDSVLVKLLTLAETEGSGYPPAVKTGRGTTAASAIFTPSQLEGERYFSLWVSDEKAVDAGESRRYAVDFCWHGIGLAWFINTSSAESIVPDSYLANRLLILGYQQDIPTQRSRNMIPSSIVPYSAR